MQVRTSLRLSQLVFSATVSFLLFQPFTASAQSYPSKPILLVHGFAPGNAIDVFNRPIAQKLSEALGQQVIVDTKQGATGTIANDFVSRAPADGYTLLAAPSSAIASAPHLFPIKYDPLAFTPIIQIAQFSFVLTARPDFPVTGSRDLIALAKKKPGEITFSSPGLGTGFHLAGELFASMAGIKLSHIPYKGGGGVEVGDVIAGRVDMMWNSLGVVRGHIEAGRLRPIGTTGASRAAALPDVPTLAETGLPGYEFGGWHGIFGPPGMPRQIVDLLNKTIAKILRESPEIKDIWAKFAMETVSNTPEQFAERVRNDFFRFEKIIKTVDLKKPN